ncbi:Aspartic proteinase CDR1 [Bienertia sinuspersici]
MAIIIHFNSLLLSLIVTLTFISTTNGALPKQGFTLDLIHRDSLNSPLYNPSLNIYDRLKDTIQRSVSRINHFNPSSSMSPNDVESQVIPANGEYVMEVSIGTPPVKQFGIVDTGSDLIWTQCQPCVNCYKQSIPIFNPRNSSTYKVQPCSSKVCQYLDDKQRLCSRRGQCGYQYSYGDNSHTSGDLATETLTFMPEEKNGTTSAPSVSFGCGYDNEGTFREQGSGLIGLGGGPLSLATQLRSTIGGKFSYCLIPFFQEGNFTSKINFGSKGAVSGPGVVSTPLVKKTPETFYYLTLEGISVGNDKISFFSKNHKNNSSLSADDYGGDEGNIIIDSGTTLTLLPSDLYDELTKALERAIDGKKVEDPTGTLELCYQATKDLNIPKIIAHFSGADLELGPINTFVKVSEDVVCLAMLPADEVAIFGNLAQGNFLVGYDTEQGKVSFKPTDCTKTQ